jgi:hypothetical protein
MVTEGAGWGSPLPSPLVTNGHHSSPLSSPIVVMVNGDDNGDEW